MERHINYFIYVGRHEEAEIGSELIPFDASNKLKISYACSPVLDSSVIFITSPLY